MTKFDYKNLSESDMINISEQIPLTDYANMGENLPRYAQGLFDEPPGPGMRRKRRKLADFNTDEKTARRKLKNRIAAQTARDRKRIETEMQCEKLSETKEEVIRLRQDNESLRNDNASLREDNARLRQENAELREKLQFALSGRSQSNIKRKRPKFVDFGAVKKSNDGSESSSGSVSSESTCSDPQIYSVVNPALTSAHCNQKSSADAKRGKTGCFPESNGRDPSHSRDVPKIGKFTTEEATFGQIYASNGETLQETKRATNFRTSPSVLSTSPFRNISSDLENSLQEYGNRNITRNPSGGYNSVHFEVVKIPTNVSPQHFASQQTAPKIQSVESTPRHSPSGASFNASITTPTSSYIETNETSQSSSKRSSSPQSNRSDDDDSFIDDMLNGIFKSEEFEQLDLSETNDAFEDIFADLGNSNNTLSAPSDKGESLPSMQDNQRVKTIRHKRRDITSNKLDELCTTELQDKTSNITNVKTEKPNFFGDNNTPKCSNIKVKPVATIQPQISSTNPSGDLGTSSRSAAQNQTFQKVDVKNCKILTPLNSKIIHGSNGQIYLYVPE